MVESAQLLSRRAVSPDPPVKPEDDNRGVTRRQRGQPRAVAPRSRRGATKRCVLALPLCHPRAPTRGVHDASRARRREPGPGLLVSSPKATKSAPWEGEGSGPPVVALSLRRAGAGDPRLPPATLLTGLPHGQDCWRMGLLLPFLSRASMVLDKKTPDGALVEYPLLRCHDALPLAVYFVLCRA